MKTKYYYLIEEFNTDGDISETTNFGKLSDLIQYVKTHGLIQDIRNGYATYALVRETSDDGYNMERGYAYEQQGVIPTMFDNGYKVPQRFL